MLLVHLVCVCVCVCVSHKEGNRVLLSWYNMDNMKHTGVVHSKTYVGVCVCVCVCVCEYWQG